MANIIKVSVAAGVVDVEQGHNDHVVCRKKNWQRIEFHLQTGGQNLEFEQLGIAAAGFSWITTPGDGIFREPQSKNGKTITLDVLHKPTDPAAVFIYMLRVRNMTTGDVYSSTASATPAVDPNPTGPCGPLPNSTTVTSMMVSDNPIIINR